MPDEIGTRVDLVVYGIFCASCNFRVETCDRDLLARYARMHINHVATVDGAERRLLFLAVISSPPELFGNDANFEPIFQEGEIAGFNSLKIGKKLSTT